MVVALSVLALLVPGRSDAQAWRLVQMNEDTFMLADADTVRVVGANRLVWSALASRTAENDTSYTLIRYQVDCPMEMMAPIFLSAYDYEGEITASGAFTEPSESVIPGSLLSGVLKAACDSEWPSEHSFESIEEMLALLRTGLR